MKRRLMVVLTLLLLGLPNVVLAAMCSDPTHVINIDAIPNRNLKIQKIVTSLSPDPNNGYCKFKSAQDGTCEVCFQMAAPLTMLNTDATKSFDLAISANETRGVSVSGLKLSRDNAMVSSLPLVNVSNAGGKQLTVNDVVLGNVKDGIVLSGVGLVELSSSTITGDANKTGTCIDVKANNVVLDGVSASNCKKGVLVEAEGVTIKNNSKIFENKYGVEIADNQKGTKIEESLVYKNIDAGLTKGEYGIHLIGGAAMSPIFFDIINEQPEEVAAGDTIYEFKSKRMLVQPMFSIGETRESSMDFYVTFNSACMDPGQGCDFVKTGTPAKSYRILLNPAELTNKKVIEYPLPPEMYNKSVVAIYTDPQDGVMGFTRPFKALDGGVVVFVANPYDIPTTSGESDESGSSQSSGGSESSMGAESGAAAEGTGDSLVSEAGAVGGAAAAGPKCTLDPNASFASSFGLDVVCLGVGLWVLATLRAWGSRPRVTVLARSPRNELKRS